MLISIMKTTQAVTMDIIASAKPNSTLTPTKELTSRPDLYKIRPLAEGWQSG